MNNKDLGLGWIDKLTETQRKIEKATGSVDKYFSASMNVQKSLGAINAATIARKYTMPMSAAEYVTSPAFHSKMLLDDYAVQAAKSSSIVGLAMAGSTLSTLVSSQIKMQEVKRADALISDIRTNVVSHSNIYNTFLTASEKMSQFLTVPSSIFGMDAPHKVFTARNFIENKTLTAFDVASGSTFSSVLNLYRNIDEKQIQDNITSVTAELASNAKLKEEVGDLIKVVSEVKDERSYTKIDEFFTDWADRMVKRFGLSKQNVYFIVIFVIFITSTFISAYIKEAITPKKAPIVYNIANVVKVVQAPKNPGRWFTVKDCPVYEKNHTTSRRLGTIREESTVELLKMKDGWCQVKGVIEVIKKDGKIKVKKDSLGTCWLPQMYLEFVKFNQ